MSSLNRSYQNQAPQSHAAVANQSRAAAAPVSEHQRVTLASFGNKEQRNAIYAVGKEIESISSTWKEFQKCSHQYTKTVSELNKATSDLFSEYANAVKTLPASPGDPFTKPDSRNPVLQRRSTTQALQEHMPFTPVTTGCVKWWSYRVTTNSNLCPVFSCEDDFPYTIDGKSFDTCDEEAVIRILLCNIMKQCYAFKVNKYGTMDANNGSNHAPRTRDELMKAFFAHMENADRYQRIEDGKEKTWSADDIAIAAKTIKYGAFVKHGESKVFSLENCKVTYQKTEAAFDEFGGTRGRGIDSVTGLFRFQRDSKLIQRVKPICALKPRVIEVEFLGGSMQDTRRGFKVEQYYEQLEKPFLCEHSKTTVSDKSIPQEGDADGNVTTKQVILKINEHRFRTRKNGEDIKTKHVSLERHVLLRVAQLQLDTLRDKFNDGRVLDGARCVNDA